MKRLQHSPLSKLLIFVLLFTLGLPREVSAQIGSVPHTFQSGSVISSSDMNSNFSTVYAAALNRGGGSMTGTLNVMTVLPVTDATYALGSSSFVFTNVYTAALTCTGCIGATQIAATAVTPASYGSSTAMGAFTVDADGRLTAASSVTPQLTLTSTYFSSLSGANITALNGTNISSGTVAPARLGSGSPSSATFLRGDGAWSTLSGANLGTVFTSTTTQTDGSYTAPHDAFVVISCSSSGEGDIAVNGRTAECNGNGTAAQTAPMFVIKGESYTLHSNGSATFYIAYLGS